MTKNTKITIVGVVALLLIIVVYASYALLTTTSNINNLDISADINGPLKFDATGGTSFELDVDAGQMDSSKVGNVVASADDTMTVTLETDGMEGICCSYDFIWEWDETDTERNQYHLSEGGIDEYVLSGSLTETYLLNGNTASISHTNPVFKLQVPNYNGQKLANSVHRTSICNNTKELTTKATQTYSLNASFYNLNVAQDNLRGAQLSSKIKIDNVVCKKQVTLSEEVLAQVQEKDHSSSQDGSVYRVIDQNGVRYEGKDPNNYVTFNNETWRIIGAFNGSDIGLQEGEYYTKIIKETSIGNYAYGNEDWSIASLKTYLNKDYYNSLNDSQMVASALWYLGTIANPTGKGSDDFYDIERNASSAVSVPNVSATIGLMYPSDYGYAAYGNNCNNSSAELINYQGTCGKADWLTAFSMSVVDNELTITSQGLNSAGIYTVEGDYVNYGDLASPLGGAAVGDVLPVRPTLYLKNDVVITGGTGSKNDPYTLDYKAPTLSEEVLAQVRDDDYTSSQDGTIYKVTKEEVAYNNITLDAGIRYEGKDPDNYVTFNGETAGWRIIGVFEGSTIGLEPGKQYTKIVRNTSLGYFAWDDDSNDWETSTLNAYLNGEYYSSLTDSNKIAYANYNIGIIEDGYDSTSNIFINERNKTSRGYIGLLNLSDKRFSGYDGTCDNQVADSCYNGASQAWANPDWGGWIINASTDNRALTMGTSSPFPDVVNSEDWMVYPTLYLEHNVIITGGDGSQENPYTLDIGPSNLSEEVLAKASDDDYTSSQDSTIYKVAHETVEYEGKTLDAGVRYEGKDPDNYVTFNGETAGWRIIGVFEGSTIGLEPGKQYTKIIRNTRIDSHEWDDNENDWTNSTLNTYLNGTYLSSMTDSDKIAKYNGNYSTWYLRGTSNYTNLYSQDWYVTERYTGQAGYRGGTQYAADTETKGAIGLMYPSDYGFGAYGSGCDNNSAMTLGRYNNGCAAVDWLATDSINNTDWEWLISPHPDGPYDAFRVSGGSGGYVDYINVIDPNAVRPTLYLSSDIMITGGTGSKANPYTLE